MLRHVDDAFVLATCGPFVIAVWRGVPTRSRLELTLASMGEHAVAIGAPIAMLVVVEDGSPPPSEEDLSFLQPFIKKPSTAIRAMSAVFETTAPDAEQIHRIAETVLGAIAPRFETKLCFAVDEACAWIVPRVVPGAEPLHWRALARTVEEVRGQITAPRRSAS